MPTKLDIALDLASRSFYVFPLYPENNIPIKEWQELSSRNPETVKKWWAPGGREYNIGIDTRKSGVVAVDVDVKKGKKGRESYELLDKEHGWGETLIFKTPSGGLHLIYEGTGFKNSVEKLAPGIDIRCDGGLIVAPGSIRNGVAYRILRDKPIATLPSWLEEKLNEIGKAVPLNQRNAGKTIIADMPTDIAAAIDFLQNHEPAVEGHGGDNHTYVTFCQLKERGISLHQAVELADEHWNPRCTPMWDHEELVTKASSAYKSSHNATGAKSPVADFESQLNSIQPEKPKIITGRFNEGFIPPASLDIPARDWAFGNMFLAKQVGMIIAEPGVGKSTFSLSMALSKIVNRPLLGIDPRGHGAVGIFNNEDTMDEMGRRLRAAMQYFNIRDEDLLYPDVTQKGSMLFLNGREKPLRIAQRLEDGRLKAFEASALIDYALEHALRMLIIDPFSMTHPGSENSNEEILRVGEIYNHVADKTNAAVVLIHHTRKKDKASSEGHSGNLDSARGASALGGLVRSAYTLDSISSQVAKQRGIGERDRRYYVMLQQAKANMAAPEDDTHFYKRHGEIIGQTLDNIDGESVGVLMPIKLESVGDPALRVLIEDIEKEVEFEPKIIPDIVRALLLLPFHHDKQPSTLTKKIQRLFSGGMLTGYRGTMRVEDVKGNGGRNPSKYIHWDAYGDAKSSLSDII